MRTDGKEKKTERRHLLEYFCGAQMYGFKCKKGADHGLHPFINSNYDIFL